MRKNIVPVLEKAIDIMEYVAAAPDVVSLPELQKALQIPQATCYRLVTTLTERGWLEKRGGKFFGIAPGMAEISGKTAFRLEKYRKLQPLMNRIVAKAGFSAKFSVRDGAGSDFINVCTAKNKNESIVFSDVGFRASMRAPASVGTIFLAEESPGARAAIVGVENLEILKTNLRFYAERKYAFQPGSAAPDADYHFDTLSIPVRFDGRLVGVLSFMSFPGMLSAKKENVVASVRGMIPEFAEKADL